MSMEEKNGKQTPPAQQQNQQPGIESKMQPEPEYIRNNYQGSEKLKDKVALITGGDSGIGRAVSVHFAKEGADVAIVYLNEHEDAKETKRLVELEGRQCLLISGDIGDQSFCESAVTETLDKYKKIDILINNAAEQHPQGKFLDITSEQLEKTFRTNVFSMFYITKAVLPNLKEGSSIINTSSITAYQGSKDLIDYSATKGAITSFTRSLSEELAEKGIRVNGVAPGPIWTPLIPSTFSKEKVGSFGGNTPMKRPGQPKELAPAYVYLASDDSSYVSGQMIHVNGGIIVAG
ncbi:SDR family oxidoreductase [Virgibacillus halodenitrificans]|uniref:SDR family oxidoreductase n=1 Tax=Virgibacillus halodenitrificans TaxID=1482 RepID=A0ABR7VKG8_VIRHA|nr:SDR family oxidoreductase [Virgibacillus halodenitrificans]MBD1221766.1 SDR family oxidoreductase [Virgibacillus halodenitrificans]MEC2158617.1 SDR family oxidoreductase [Virgibacillus halodenitrificans]MYL46215.1 SDR family oxidoreductase [Virgibacillus halodenitrificans]MYL56545.1 SDR family oxidoreductase [Virgibacillus halodenitrificans]